jgi:hypothetical protein
MIFYRMEMKSSLSVEAILMVSEYHEVFPGDIFTLPPEREAEFSIDLVSSARPVSKDPYRMSP